MKKLLSGIDKFCTDSTHYKNLKIGLVTNNVATNSVGISSRVAMLKADLNIKKLFSPEHGLTATAADGAHISNSVDSVTKLPIVSLYSDKLYPTEKDLQNIDTLVFDIPDVGCRFYTYLWTMTYIMEACAKYNKSFIVLDRPNPISGDFSKVEGPMLDNKTASFLGRWNVPIRHSCTLGELALYFANQKIPHLNIQVIKLQNWDKDNYADTNWAFSPTSPAIKDVETVLLYPGMGLLEGINVNEGRGTNHDFKVLGAPWINADLFQKQLVSLELPGISFSTISYTPKWGLYKNETCRGIKLKITDSDVIRPVALGLAIIKLLISHYPKNCTQRLYKTNANPSGQNHLDKLLGVQNSFHFLKTAHNLETKVHQSEWQDLMQPFLLY